MRVKQIEIITKRRGLGKESKALAFKPRNKEHNVLIAAGILEHVSHVEKGVTGLLSVPNGRKFRPPQDLQ